MKFFIVLAALVSCGVVSYMLGFDTKDREGYQGFVKHTQNQYELSDSHAFKLGDSGNDAGTDHICIPGLHHHH